MISDSQIKGYLCPECRLLVAADHTLVGDKATCPGCSAALLIPRASDMVPPLGAELLSKGGTSLKVEPQNYTNRRKEEWQLDLPKEMLAAKAGGLPWFMIIPAGLIGIFLLVASIIMMQSTEGRAVEEITKPVQTLVSEDEGVREAIESYLTRLSEANSAEEFFSLVKVGGALEQIENNQNNKDVSELFSFSELMNFGELRSENSLFFSMRNSEGKTQTGVLLMGTNGYLLDWDAFVGYSEMTIEQLRNEQPISPKMVRTYRVRNEYYNLGFSSDEWQSFELRFPYTDDTLIGYAKREGALLAQLLPIGQQEGGKAMTLSIRYPKDPKANNLVIIDSVLSEDWYLEETTK